MLKTASLTPLQYEILLNKATEYPFTGLLTDNERIGSYLCRNCGVALFRATQKFHSGCGWASFDDAIIGRVLQVPDADGRRIEIVCSNCTSHLGHVFHGEGFTESNTRHCVNSACLDFVDSMDIDDSNEIILAAGCFWGVEYYLKRITGVVLTEVGYCGGHINEPTYNDVKQGTTGYLEVVRVVWDNKIQSLENILKMFFETHDPEQVNGQGPDIGSQYLSAIFYYDLEQRNIAENVMNMLTDKGYNLATQLRQMDKFWVAEDYHHNYYDLKDSVPYCHGYQKKF